MYSLFIYYQKQKRFPNPSIQFSQPYAHHIHTFVCIGGVFNIMHYIHLMTQKENGWKYIIIFDKIPSMAWHNIIWFNVKVYKFIFILFIFSIFFCFPVCIFVFRIFSFVFFFSSLLFSVYASSPWCILGGNFYDQYNPKINWIYTQITLARSRGIRIGIAKVLLVF